MSVTVFRSPLWKGKHADEKSLKFCKLYIVRKVSNNFAVLGDLL
jgi:hypothetical protein